MRNASHLPASLPANTLITTQSNTAATNLAMFLMRATNTPSLFREDDGRREQVRLFPFSILLVEIL